MVEHALNEWRAYHYCNEVIICPLNQIVAMTRQVNVGFGSPKYSGKEFNHIKANLNEIKCQETTNLLKTMVVDKRRSK